MSQLDSRIRRARTGRIGTLLVACVASGSLGCVASGTHLAVVAERDALASDKVTLEQEVAALRERTSELTTAEQELASRLAAREQEVAELRSTYDGLVADLRSELDSGKVRIEQMQNGIRVSLDDEILFPSGSAELDEAGSALLVKVAGQMAKSPYGVEVEGHTDDRPIRERLATRYPTNWELAGARSASVVRLLQSEGIEGTRLRVVSLAEFAPVASNDSEDGRARNRRIEIRLRPASASAKADTAAAAAAAE